MSNRIRGGNVAKAVTRAVTNLAVLALALATIACTPPAFHDRPIVWKVNTTRNIAEPREREFFITPVFADLFFFRRLTRALEIPVDTPSRNTNALDEVPDSSWFTNRLGVRQVSPKEAATGPSAKGPPRLPLTVIKGKSGGGNPGFFVLDADQRKFLIKFDTKKNPEMQTATSVIVNRIFWTLGYNVPNDTVFVFRRDQLVLSPKAKISDELNNKRKMTKKDVEEILATSPKLPSGAYRASASEFLPGIPKGGWPAEGTRSDDPNDKVPHQLRRELRGLRVFAAWVSHSDMKEDNTIDMYVKQGGRRFLRHYLLDFGEALGAHAAEKGRYEDGYEHFWDWQRQPRALVSFGFWTRPWEYLKDTRWLSIGAFSADHFDPTYWREAYPYWPFFMMDAADAYWAAKLVMRFDRPLLSAIVRQGEFSDPKAAAYLVNALIGRRDKIGRAYLETLTPLDNFTVGGGKLCAVDLGLRYRLASAGVVQRIDRKGKLLSRHTVDRSGRVCLPLPASDKYTVYRLRIVRGNSVKPPMQIHLKGGPRARILGLLRVER